MRGAVSESICPEGDTEGGSELTPDEVVSDVFESINARLPTDSTLEKYERKLSEVLALRSHIRCAHCRRVFEMSLQQAERALGACHSSQSSQE